MIILRTGGAWVEGLRALATRGNRPLFTAVCVNFARSSDIENNGTRPWSWDTMWSRPISQLTFQDHVIQARPISVTLRAEVE
jgi:hypothetical protein